MNVHQKQETNLVGPLYAADKKVYPQSVHGRFRRIKWAFMAFALGLYYILPFVRWHRGLDAPDQAVLVDIPHRRFYFFFIELWPQEVYYFTGLLIIAALTLFLLNAVAGRVWCGYMCPQTVWTDLFYMIERAIEGDRRDRMRKAREGLTLKRVWELAAKHSLWLALAWWTGGAWVLYFADAPTLVHDLATFRASSTVYIWIAILTFTTYALAGHMREQVCVYMCPWPRIQAALTDEWALNVTYRGDRGEPRVSAKKAVALRQKGEPAGDCVDCRQCVAVCPTGVDIRHGSQLGCIQCGLCIDACDNVMNELGRQTGLIAYDNDINADRRRAGLPEIYRVIRPRTVLYVVLIAMVAGFMAYVLANKKWTGVNVLHDRNPLATELSDGSIQNGYTVRLLNKNGDPRTFQLHVEGLKGAHIRIAGEVAAKDEPTIEVGPDQTLELRLLVVAPKDQAPRDAADVVFFAKDMKTGVTASAKDHFFPH
ncbi:cytochrome c oxidase accessory protein CcoG [Rhodoblastus sp. 17X3]|uniref:cytochrome c oxidase accessory protein CcoG n=1 Tax=Rhodoblastus sp. 17X3 TaxID=3047026 RepID=UPI0024B73EAB|nr:cytochrome c oxidase accessory protein CcoG [Rhodoblastus sp. 17X3]MDI9850212.1 cytochrome c oxidase accessory protein CcoG [Rhodoblastus sp. 17X3]